MEHRRSFGPAFWCQLVDLGCHCNVEAIADPTNPPLNLDESGTVNTPHSILFRMDNSYGGCK